MQPISVSPNQSSQSYGQDATGNVLPDAAFKAMVVEKLDNQLYLIKFGKHTIEAQIAADLQEGVEYQFIVEKNSVPPKLALYNPDETGSKPRTGLTPEQERWMDRFLGIADKSSGQVAKLELFLFLKSLGYNISSDPEEVFANVQRIIAGLEKLDAAPPVVRQVLGQTLLYSMNGQSTDAALLQSNQIFENTIKLSGEIPTWTEQESKVLIDLRNLIDGLSADEKASLKALMLGLNKGGKEADLLQKLEQLLAQVLKKSNQSQEGIQSDAKLIAGNIVKDANARFFLGATTVQPESESSISMSIDRKIAIGAFQKQAPGLAGSTISNLLEQFVSLGGKLEKLGVRDVVAAQLSWKTADPSSMQVHRSGALLYLSQDLPLDSKNFDQSPLTKGVDEQKLPVILDKKIASDPSASSVSMSKLQDFSNSSKLPNSFHISRLLQIWSNSGYPISDLRSQVEAVQTWNQLIESHPEIRSQLSEYLLKNPAFLSEFSSFVSEESSSSLPLRILPETRSMLSEALRQSGVEINLVPKKYVQSVLTAVQVVAGEGQVPENKLITLASWLMGKNIEVTPQSLRAMSQFQKGQSEMLNLLSNFQKLKQTLPVEVPSHLKEGLDKMVADLQKSGSLKQVLSFYQKGNGAQLRQMLNQLHDYLSQLPQKSVQVQQQIVTLQTMMQHLSGQEEFLNGLKYYNVQAQRNDTPQLYEIPVMLGEDTERAYLKIFKRNSGGSKKDDQQDYKVVIDLDLEGLGKVRSEVSLFKKHLQLDFLSPEQNSVDILKDRSDLLVERLQNNELKASLGFKVKDVDEQDIVPAKKSVTTEKPKSNIDYSA